jgi:ABC-2 type transport system permease protein
MKLFTLVKKEIRELVTMQAILSMIIMVVLFMFIGNVVGNEIKKNNIALSIAILDLDRSEISKEAVDYLKNNNFKVTELSGSFENEAIESARNKGAEVILTIPPEFGENIHERKSQTVGTYTVIKSFTLASVQKNSTLDQALAALNDHFSSRIVKEADPGIDPAEIKSLIKRDDTVVIGEKEARINPNRLISFIQSQTTFIPIILFMVIIFASSMIAVAIATEKENKTLETLLTMPIDRRLIVLAKMIGAGVVAMGLAAVYLFGIRYYMNGISGNVIANADNPGQAISQLGLALDPSGYLILGITLFLGIMCGLSLATIIGAFSQDAKNAQSLISPLMIMVMIPYFLTMFIDMSTASLAMKLIIYINPFSYSFLAVQNIFFHNYFTLVAGVIYQLAFFAFFVFLSSKIFSSDKIVTMRFNLRKQKK